MARIMASAAVFYFGDPVTAKAISHGVPAVMSALFAVADAVCLCVCMFDCLCECLCVCVFVCVIHCKQIK